MPPTLNGPAFRKRGITLIAADSPDAFLDDTPTSRLIRQVLGSVSEFEKAMLVSKLRGARERKRANSHKVEGRKSHAEARSEVVALAKTLQRIASPMNGCSSSWNGWTAGHNGGGTHHI